MLGAAVLAAMPSGPAAAFPDDPVVPATLSPLTAEQQAHLTFLRDLLLSSDTTRRFRVGAASGLLLIDRPEATTVLIDAIRLADADRAEAVADAVRRSTATPPPALLDAFLSRLGSFNGGVDDFSAALARFGPPAADALRAAARTGTEVARRDAVRCLARFPDPPTRRLLADLVRPGNETPASVTVEVRRLLANLNAPSPEAWSALDAWASAAPRDGRADTDLLAARASLSELEGRYNELARRFSRLLDAFYLNQENTAVLERLPADLRDELLEVRTKAVEKLETLLRDMATVPEEVENSLRARFDADAEDPALRARIARMLDLLDHDGLAEALAARVRTDPFPAVAVLIELIAKHPSSAGLDAVLTRLNEIDRGSAVILPVTQTLWSLARDLPERHDDIWQNVKGLDAGGSPAPSVARLIALLAPAAADELDGEPLRRAEGYLDSPDARLRAYVAEGLAARGRTEALRRYRTDAVVYPHLLNGLRAAFAPGELDRLDELIDLQPPTEELATAWRNAVQAYASAFPEAQRLAADDRLANVPRADPGFRAEILLDRRPPNQPVPAAVAERVLELHWQAAEVNEAQALLDRLDAPTRALPAFQQWRFRFAVRAENIQAAAELQPDPLEWLDTIATLDEARARRVVDAMLVYFANLDESTRNRLVAARDRARTADGDDS